MPGYTNSDHRGQDYGGVDRNTSLVTPYSDYEVLDASAGDAEPSDAYKACRSISADTGGIVKIDFKSEVTGKTVTEVLTLVSGILRPVRNVLKLYRYYEGSTPGTAKSYKSDGSEVTNAIKVHAG